MSEQSFGIDERAALTQGSIALAQGIVGYWRKCGVCVPVHILEYVDQATVSERKVSPRAAAREQGFNFYRGAECPRCETSLKDVHSGHCVECHRRTNERAREDRRFAELRAAALKARETSFHGRRCDACHTTERAASTGRCIQCAKTYRDRATPQSEIPSIVRKELEVIAARHGTTLDDVMSDSRLAKFVRPRKEMWVYLRARKYSFPRIAAIFNRDTSTIQAGVKRQKAVTA